MRKSDADVKVMTLGCFSGTENGEARDRSFLGVEYYCERRGYSEVREDIMRQSL